VDEKQIRDLMEYLASSNFAEFELERDGFKLRLVKGVRGPVVVQPAADAPQVPPDPAVAAHESPAEAVASPAEAPDDDLEAIPSPMVGTFYRAPNPNADPFVEVGDVVQPGQVIGIVEAMKLMNEIEADRVGEIVEIPVANGQPVEYGETIFRIRPVA
jgi:oxaloacetate decarboxylase alpha subunit